jgi:hypothetical protein
MMDEQREMSCEKHAGESDYAMQLCSISNSRHALSSTLFAVVTMPIPIPNRLIKVRRRWGQRHPQGANSGSNGKLELMPNS